MTAEELDALADIVAEKLALRLTNGAKATSRVGLEEQDSGGSPTKAGPMDTVAGSGAAEEPAFQWRCDKCGKTFRLPKWRATNCPKTGCLGMLRAAQDWFDTRPRKRRRAVKPRPEDYRAVHEDMARIGVAVPERKR